MDNADAMTIDRPGSLSPAALTTATRSLKHATHLLHAVGACMGSGGDDTVLVHDRDTGTYLCTKALEEARGLHVRLSIDDFALRYHDRNGPIGRPLSLQGETRGGVLGWLTVNAVELLQAPRPVHVEQRLPEGMSEVDFVFTAPSKEERRELAAFLREAGEVFEELFDKPAHFDPLALRLEIDLETEGFDGMVGFALASPGSDRLEPNFYVHRRDRDISIVTLQIQDPRPILTASAWIEMSGGGANLKPYAVGFLRHAMIARPTS